METPQEIPQPQQSHRQPPIDDFELKMKLGKIRMNKDGILEEIPDDEKPRKREKTVYVDPELRREERLASKVKEAGEELERARTSLQRATENPANATVRGGDIAEAPTKKIEAKASWVRDAFVKDGALKEVWSAFEQAGNLSGASELLDSKEATLTEKLRAKSEERQDATERGDSEGARILGEEREKLIEMREVIARAREELKKL